MKAVILELLEEYYRVEEPFQGTCKCVEQECDIYKSRGRVGSVSCMSYCIHFLSLFLSRWV